MLRLPSWRTGLVLLLPLAIALLAVGRAPPGALREPALQSGIFASLALAAFICLLWRGASVLWAAPALAGFLALVNGATPPVPFFETSFAVPAAAFVAKFLPIFVMSAVFGHALAESGCAGSLAGGLARGVPRCCAPLVVAGVCGLLAMGGVGVFVIAFSVFPVARAIYQRERLPAGLAPAAIALGAFTMTMTAIPGAPSLNNIIASAHLGTTAFAAPVPGLAAALVMAVFGGWWLVRRAARAPMAPEPRAEEAAAPGLPFALALAPLLVALAAGWVLSWLFAARVPGQMGQMGPTYWAVMLALGCGLAAAAAIGGAHCLRLSLDRGAAAAVGPLLGTAAGFGFGATLAATPAATGLSGAIVSGLSGAALASSAATTALYTGIVGSSSGGLALWFQAGAPGATDALPPDLLHRIAVLASGCIDTAPHGAAVIALLAICQSSHARAYADIFVVTVAGPVLGLLAAFATLAVMA
ncbi:GntP family permease [Poseidonocella sp. HB161398]|uniref:GntP family permease n=1 Tax=Poseidonocella sp. HB161398 TaxID=2320855 RepID=UPI001107E811|nr:GntP family permease [Poseidonocella sp. HB161398]